MKSLILLVLLLASCATSLDKYVESENSKEIVIAMMSPKEVQEICAADSTVQVLGCAFPFEEVCIIAVPYPPEGSYLPYIDKRTPEEYTIIGHELLHCFSWAHERY